MRIAPYRFPETHPNVESTCFDKYSTASLQSLMIRIRRYPCSMESMDANKTASCSIEPELADVGEGTPRAKWCSALMPIPPLYETKCEPSTMITIYEV